MKKCKSRRLSVIDSVSFILDVILLFIPLPWWLGFLIIVARRYISMLIKGMLDHQ